MPGRTWRDNGHKALCPLSVSRALSGNEYVTSVDISCNGELTTAGVRQLAEALPKSKVEHVAIGNGCFGVSKEAKDEVCKACELNRASR